MVGELWRSQLPATRAAVLRELVALLIRHRAQAGGDIALAHGLQAAIQTLLDTAPQPGSSVQAPPIRAVVTSHRAIDTAADCDPHGKIPLRCSCCGRSGFWDRVYGEEPPKLCNLCAEGL